MLSYHFRIHWRVSSDKRLESRLDVMTIELACERPTCRLALKACDLERHIGRLLHCGVTHSVCKAGLTRTREAPRAKRTLNDGGAAVVMMAAVHHELFDVVDQFRPLWDGGDHSATSRISDLRHQQWDSGSDYDRGVSCRSCRGVCEVIGNCWLIMPMTLFAHQPATDHDESQAEHCRKAANTISCEVSNILRRFRRIPQQEEKRRLQGELPRPLINITVLSIETTAPDMRTEETNL